MNILCSLTQLTTPPDTPETKDAFKVFVGGLHPQFTHDEVTQLFARFGRLRHINIPLNKRTGATKGFCFVHF